MIFNIIATLLIGSAFYNSYKDFRKDSSVLRNAYLNNKIDYLWAFLIVIFVIISVGVLASIGLPKFMTWSWVSMLGSGADATSGNIITAPFRSNSVLIIVGFWFLLSLALPYLAKSEEETFRSMVFGVRKRITANIIFGLVHMFVGVPLFIALILSVVGYIFSIFYVKSFNKNHNPYNPPSSDKIAVLASTSVHAKYNFLIITLGSLLAILLTLYK
jgi:hypothetical protein